MLAPSYSVSYEGTETLDDGFDTAVVHTYAASQGSQERLFEPVAAPMRGQQVMGR